MKAANDNHACPRCGYRLVPVHASEGRKRRVFALTCPEPYCDHVELLRSEPVADVERWQPFAERQNRRPA